MTKPGTTENLVKPLYWVNNGDGGLIASAFGLAIAYKISGSQGNWDLMRTGATSYVIEEGFETQSAAKTVAEHDHIRRITEELSTDFVEKILERGTIFDALDGLLIALSTGKGIAEATDAAKAVMRRATQGKE